MDDERQSRKLRQLQAEMIALANDREKATSADECRAIDAKLRALAERGAAMKHVKMSPEEKPCAACKRPTARTVVSEGRAHRFCSVECASSGVRIKACRLDGVEVDVPSLRRRRVRERHGRASHRPAPRLEPDGRERGRGAATAAETDRPSHARREEGRTGAPRHDRGLRRGAAAAAAAA